MKIPNVLLYLFVGALAGAFLIGSVGLLVGTQSPVRVSIFGACAGALVAGLYGSKNKFQ